MNLKTKQQKSGRETQRDQNMLTPYIRGGFNKTNTMKFRAQVSQALCIVSEARSTMKIPLGILSKFHIVWM